MGFVLDNGVAESARDGVGGVTIGGVGDNVDRRSVVRPKPMAQSASLRRLFCQFGSQRQQ